MASAARCSFSASSGLTIQPSAALRFARWRSAERSRSISTFTRGSRPELSSSRSAIVVAIAPIDPVCRSRITRSGVRFATTPATSRPSRHTVNDVSGPESAATTSSRTASASVASRMCTAAR